MIIAKLYEGAVYNFLRFFYCLPQPYSVYVATINDVIAFWQTKTMLLFKSVHFKSLRE